MPDNEPSDALSDEERKALRFFSEEDERRILARPVEEQKAVLAELVRWSKGAPTALDKELREMRKHILDQFPD